MAKRQRPDCQVVVNHAGAQHVIGGRVARMIAWLVANRQTIEAIPRGKAEVGFSHDYQEWRVTQIYPE